MGVGVRCWGLTKRTYELAIPQGISTRKFPDFHQEFDTTYNKMHEWKCINMNPSERVNEKYLLLLKVMESIHKVWNPILKFKCMHKIKNTPK